MDSSLKEEHKIEADGGYGGFLGDERLLPVDGRKVLRNREMETEGETNRGWEGWLLNAAT